MIKVTFQWFNGSIQSNLEGNYNYITFPISFSTRFFAANITERTVSTSNTFIPIYGFREEYTSLTKIAVQAHFNAGPIGVSPKTLAIGY